MDKENIFTNLAKSIQDNLNIISNTDKEHITIIMELFIREPGKKIKNMDREHFNYQMLFTKATFKITKSVVMVFMNRIMVQNMKVIGLMVNSMVKEKLLNKMEWKSGDNFKMGF